MVYNDNTIVMKAMAFLIQAIGRFSVLSFVFGWQVTANYNANYNFKKWTQGI